MPLDDIHPAFKEHVQRLRNGCVLLATEGLDDPNFTATIILLCLYNTDGAFGMVLNRPSHMPISEVFSIDEPLRNLRRTIYIGGPVNQESLQIIQKTDTPAPQSFEFYPGVHLGGEWRSLQEILQADESTTFLFLGYSGWAGGQLESEILQGAWEVYHVDVLSLLQAGESTIGGGIDAIRSFLHSIPAHDSVNEGQG